MTLSKTRRIFVLPGDGIGPEVMKPTLELLQAVAPGVFEFEVRVCGGASIDLYGQALTEETLAACKVADAVLLGAVGGPKWDSLDPGSPRPEQALKALRHGLDTYTNLRPIKPFSCLQDRSPLKKELIENVDLLVVRELTGGIYFGEHQKEKDFALDVCKYTVTQIERIARRAFQLARNKVTSVDKANVLDSSKLWREVVSWVHRQEFPGITLEHLYVDNAAMQLIAKPEQFDVLLTENLFGDILSDEAAMITGSIGLIPSACLADKGPGLFEPIHGSAPDIAGEGIANPLAMFLSAALMLRYSLDLEEEAQAIEHAVEKALVKGLMTFDLGGKDNTEAAFKKVLSSLS
jgi:3-isopropylmalate dehydrogenase